MTTTFHFREEACGYDDDAGASQFFIEIGHFLAESALATNVIKVDPYGSLGRYAVEFEDENAAMLFKLRFADAIVPQHEVDAHFERMKRWREEREAEAERLKKELNRETRKATLLRQTIKPEDLTEYLHPQQPVTTKAAAQIRPGIGIGSIITPYLFDAYFKGYPGK